jgi:valyl-tRNA synthetase
MNIPDRKELDAYLIVTDEAARRLLDENRSKIRSLAKLGKLELVPQFPGDRMFLKGVSRSAEFGLDLAGAIDLDAERERLRKERARLEEEIAKVGKKIVSHDFLARAPEEVVEENRARHAELLERFHKLQSNLRQLEG